MQPRQIHFNPRITITLSRWMFMVPGICFGIIFAMALTTMANDTELDTDPRVFPYKGYLEFDGVAFGGNVDLQFTVTDDGDCSFVEEHDNVAVYSGRFGVNLGAVTGDVPSCVFDSQRVFIQVGVRDADSVETYTALSGSQRIYPVPFAYWAAEGSDLKIDGNANIGSNLTVSGTTLLSGQLDVDGNAYFDAQVRARDTTNIGSSNSGGGFLVGNVNGNNVRFDGDEIQRFSNGNPASITLNRHGGNINVGSSLYDVNDDTLNVGENLQVAGNATATGTVQGADLNITDDAVIGDTLSTGRILMENNIAESDIVDENADYQVRLHEGSTASASYGIGIQGGTMFFNVNNDAKYRLYENGSTVLMDVAESGTAINTDLNVGGTLTSSGQLLAHTQRAFVQAFDETDSNQIDQSNRTTVELPVTTSNGFCFLTEVGMRDTNNNVDYWGCKLDASTGTWMATVYSHLGELNCQFRCVTW